MTIAEIGKWFRSRGFQFVAMGEHSQDMSEEKVSSLREQCSAESAADFCLIPGIEYSCQPAGMHILGVGALGSYRGPDPVEAARCIRSEGGFAVLAHPRRIGWSCSDDLARAVHAVEIWNLAYDGKFLPPVQAPSGFERMQRQNPELLAVASHDAHRTVGFYDVGIEMETPALTRDAIVARLQEGHYRIQSRYFSAGPREPFARGKAFYVPFLSAQLSTLRKIRTMWLRWSA